MTRERSAAILDAVEIGLCPVPGRVESNRKPKVAAPLKEKTKQQSAEEQVQNPKPGLPWVFEVAVSKDNEKTIAAGQKPIPLANAYRR